MRHDKEAEDAIAHAALDVRALLHKHTDMISADFDLDRTDTLDKLRHAVAAELAGPTSLELDGRAARWLCRFRLYDQTRPDEPVADTDPELGADAPGTWEVSGLPTVGTLLQDLCRQHHGNAPLSGMSPSAVDRSLRGLRPTLSRNNGKAVWRMHYDTVDTYRATATTMKRGFMARVDIQKINPTKEA